jgi:hypothetical protein
LRAASRAVATSSRRPARRCPSVSSVMVAELWPSICWTTLGGDEIAAGTPSASCTDPSSRPSLPVWAPHPGGASWTTQTSRFS